jgi:hypothetical protein
VANIASNIVGGTGLFLEAMVGGGVDVTCSAGLDRSAASEVTSRTCSWAGEALVRLLVGVTGHENRAGLVRYV